MAHITHNTRIYTHFFCLDNIHIFASALTWLWSRLVFVLILHSHIMPLSNEERNCVNFVDSMGEYQGLAMHARLPVPNSKACLIVAGHLLNGSSCLSLSQKKMD